MDDHIIITTQKESSVIDSSLLKDFYCLGICLKGKMALQTGIEKITISKKQIFCLSPNEFRTWLNPSKKPQFICIFFSDTFYNTSLQENYQLKNASIFSPLSPITINIDKEDKTLLLNAVSVLKTLAERKNNNSSRAQLHLIYYLYQEIISSRQESTDNRPNEITRAFKSLVKVHHTDLIRVSDYAKLLKITPKHLSQMVKDTSGITAGELIEKIRFEEAKQMLSNSEISIQSVAEKLKFSDQSAFGKFFKRHYGKSPLQYKKLKHN